VKPCRTEKVSKCPPDRRRGLPPLHGMPHSPDETAPPSCSAWSSSEAIFPMSCIRPRGRLYKAQHRRSRTALCGARYAIGFSGGFGNVLRRTREAHRRCQKDRSRGKHLTPRSLHRPPLVAPPAIISFCCGHIVTPAESDSVTQATFRCRISYIALSKVTVLGGPRRPQKQTAKLPGLQVRPTALGSSVSFTARQ